MPTADEAASIGLFVRLARRPPSMIERLSERPRICRQLRTLAKPIHTPSNTLLEWRERWYNNAPCPLPTDGVVLRQTVLRLPCCTSALRRLKYQFSQALAVAGRPSHRLQATPVVARRTAKLTRGIEASAQALQCWQTWTSAPVTRW
jgi:hypothetical protein